MSPKNRFIIAGAGGIGRAVGLILADKPGIDSEIYIGDLDPILANNVEQWIKEGCSAVCSVNAFKIEEKEISPEMDFIFKDGDILLDCLPGSEAPRMASIALQYQMHYVNLTEYVDETEQITRMVKDASTGFVLQSGLAPGYINILANKLYKDFVAKFQIEKVDYIKMRVGALTESVEFPHYYAFTWSPVGVATEYIKDANALREGQPVLIPALSETTKRIINGVLYEEDYTSGGAADLPTYFRGKAKNLDYKTLRYPGHYEWVKELIRLDHGKESSIQNLLGRMRDQVPHLEDDQIVLYASVSAKDRNGNMQMLEHAQIIKPMYIGSHKLKAIQTTTAAPMLEAARMLLNSNMRGPIFQSQIEPDSFLSGPFIQLVFNQASIKNSLEMVE